MRCTQSCRGWWKRQMDPSLFSGVGCELLGVSELFSCASGFSVSSAIQNTLKESGCCLFKFLKALLSLGWVSPRRPVCRHCAGGWELLSSCACVCVLSFATLSPVSNSVRGICAVLGLLWLMLRPWQVQSHHHCSCLLFWSPLVGGYKGKWSCLHY